MIVSFRDGDTRKVWNRQPCRRFQAIQDAAQRKLVYLNAVTSLQELAVRPSLRLEKLKGDRAGQFSIRINDQYRVCFTWSDGMASSVEIVDYH